MTIGYIILISQYLILQPYFRMTSKIFSEPKTIVNARINKAYCNFQRYIMLKCTVRQFITGNTKTSKKKTIMIFVL